MAQGSPTAERATKDRLRRALDRSPFEPYRGGTSESRDQPVVDRSEAGFSGTQAARVTGITYRQLDYWARTNLVRPSLSGESSSGARRRYSYKDLLELRVVKTLLDAGIKLESVREVFQYLREHVTEDIASAHLIIGGNSVVLAQDDGELVDVLSKGQGVLNVLSLASVKDEVDAHLAPLDEGDLEAADAW